MSSRKNSNKNSRTDRGASSNKGAAGFSRMDHLAVIPGVLMCLITLIMLLTDAAMPEMAQAQYRSYPALFRGANLVIGLSGIVYLSIFIASHIKQGRSPLSGLIPAGARKTSCLFFCLFIVCIILSTAVNGLDDKAIHGVSFRDIGVFDLISFVLIYMGLSSRIGSSHLRKFVLLFYITVADLIALAAAADMWISPIPAFREKKDISAIFFNGNHYGYFLVMAVLLSAGLFLYSHDPKAKTTASDSHGPKTNATAPDSYSLKATTSALRPHISKPQIFAACSMALNGFILALNGSAGCILAVSAGLLLTLAVTLTKRRDALKMNLLLLAVLAAALAVIAARTSMLQTLASDITSIISRSEDADSAGHNRWLLWTATCDYIASKPLLGYGCEGLSDILMETTGRADPHNEILSYAAQFGVPAAAFYTLGVILALTGSFTSCRDHHAASSGRKGLKLPDETQASCFLAAAGYFISSLFGVTMFYTLPFFFIFLGMSSGTSKSYQNNL